MKRLSLFFAVGGIILSAILGYYAISGEITGKTTAYSFSGGRFHRGRGTLITVSRESTPTEFRQANDLLWGMTGFCIIAAVVGVVFYRGLDD